MMRLVVVLFGLLAGAGPVLADPLVFSGRIEPSNRGALASQLDGVVAKVLFRGGQEVARGDALITLDGADATLALRSAEARRAHAQAILGGAQRDANRQEELLSRGVTPDAVAGRARTALAAAKADLALAGAERDRAELDVTRTTIRAPISGIISAPNVAVGAFLEAEAGDPLATIVTLDPVLVAYDVPYAARIAALSQSGAATLEDLFERVRLTITLPGGGAYGQPARPEFASADVDPQTGALTVWATVDNPDTILRPGLAVTVTAEIAPQADLIR